MGKKIYNTLIDEAYDLYADSHFIPPKNPNGKLLSDQLFSVISMEHSKETFVIECKKNPKFSKKWGLKIEEMELVQRERIKLLHNAWKDNGILPEDDEVSTLWIDYKNLMIKYNIPTKRITVRYKDEIIEFYE